MNCVLDEKDVQLGQMWVSAFISSLMTAYKVTFYSQNRVIVLRFLGKHHHNSFKSIRVLYLLVKLHTFTFCLFLTKYLFFFSPSLHLMTQFEKTLIFLP